jgi:hypothetical protein
MSTKPSSGGPGSLIPEGGFYIAEDGWFRLDLGGNRYLEFEVTVNAGERSLVHLHVDRSFRLDLGGDRLLEFEVVASPVAFVRLKSPASGRTEFDQFLSFPGVTPDDVPIAKDKRPQIIILGRPDFTAE